MIITFFIFLMVKHIFIINTEKKNDFTSLALVIF